MKVTGKGGTIEFAGVRLSVVSWDVRPQPTPLENFRDVRHATLRPPPLDLSPDPAARSLVRQWGRQPWQRLHALRLADRLEETGHDEHAAWARNFQPEWFAVQKQWCRSAARRAARSHILSWRRSLAEMFPG